MDEIDSKYGEALSYILDIDVKKILRETSDFNFIDIKEPLIRVKQYAEQLRDNAEFWKELPENRKRNLVGALSDMQVRLGEMSSFDSRQENPWDRLTQIKRNFENVYNGFYDYVILPLDTYLSRKAYMSGFSDDYAKKAKTSLEEIDNVLKNLESIEARANEAAAVASNVATTAHSQSFNEQANEHKTQAVRWLIGLIVTGILFVAVLAWIAGEVLSFTDLKHGDLSAAFFIVKIPLLAFAYLGLRFSVKNYSAHQHLYVINKQRSNVLNSVEAFIEGARKDETKDAVLLAGIGSAFSHQETGFITTKEGAGSEDQNLMDVVKAASGK